MLKDSESAEEVGILAQDGMADAHGMKQGQEGAADNLIEILGRIRKDSNNVQTSKRSYPRLVAMGNGFFDIRKSIPCQIT